jgi:adenylyltransferase/sulfurtransferase
MDLLNKYTRQIIFSGIQEEGQKKIINSKILIVGCGALGGSVANTLTRAGVGSIRVVDRDFIEENNLQRQILFDEDDLKDHLPKAIAVQRKLTKINSQVEIQAEVADVNYTNIERLTDGIDLVLDGTDNYETRYLINDVSIKRGIPWIYGAVVSSYGLSMNIVPDQTPCFRCVFDAPPPPGMTPTCETAGVLAPAVTLVASIQSVEAIKFLTGHFNEMNKQLIQIDVWDNKFETVKIDTIRKKRNCPTCDQRNFQYLEGREASQGISLCGRNSIQINIFSETNPHQIDLYQLAQQLQKAGPVTVNQFLLKVQVDKYELTLFADRRAIIQGTTDPAVARDIYSKFIGI